MKAPKRWETMSRRARTVPRLGCTFSFSWNNEGVSHLTLYAVEDVPGVGIGPKRAFEITFTNDEARELRRQISAYLNNDDAQRAAAR